MTDRYHGRWHDPAEPAWVVAPTSEWRPQFPGQRYPGDIGLRAAPRPAVRGRATVPGRTSTPHTGEDRWNVDEFRHRPDRADRYPPPRPGTTYPSPGPGETYPAPRRHHGPGSADARPVSPGWREPAPDRPVSPGWSTPREPAPEPAARQDPSSDRTPPRDWSTPTAGRQHGGPARPERTDRAGTPYRRGGPTAEPDPGDTQPLPPGRRPVPGAAGPPQAGPPQAGPPQAGPPQAGPPGPGRDERVPRQPSAPSWTAPAPTGGLSPATPPPAPDPWFTATPTPAPVSGPPAAPTEPSPVPSPDERPDGPPVPPAGPPIAGLRLEFLPTPESKPATPDRASVPVPSTPPAGAAGSTPDDEPAPATATSEPDTGAEPEDRPPPSAGTPTPGMVTLDHDGPVATDQPSPVDDEVPATATPTGTPVDGDNPDLADLDLPVVGAPVAAALSGAVVPEFRLSPGPQPDLITPVPDLPPDADASAPVSDLAPDTPVPGPVDPPAATPVTGRPGDPLPSPLSGRSGTPSAAPAMSTLDEPLPTPAAPEHPDDGTAEPDEEATAASAGTPEPLPHSGRAEQSAAGSSAWASTDPEQTLAAYRWRLDPDTLREVVDQPDMLRAVREQLGAKLDAATDDRARARLLSLRAVVSRILGDLDRALADGELALTHAEATGELRRIAIVKARLARVHQWRGEFDEADQRYLEANSSELPDRLRATMHEHAGRCCLEQGRYIEACNHFEQALDLRTMVDADLVARTGTALDAVFTRVAAKGWGPYPRTPEEIRYARRPPVPSFDEVTRRWGYADADGEWSIAAEYAEAQPFRDGVAWVRRPEVDAWTLVDGTGTCLISAAAGYRGVGSFSDGIAWVSRNGAGDWLAVDKSGTVRIPAGFDDVRPFRCGVAAVRRGGWGAVDRTGQVVVPTSYSGFTTALTDGRYVDGFTDEGLAVVDANGRKGVVDRTGRIVVPPAHPALVIHPVAFLVGDSGQWGALDRRGRPLIDPVHRSRLEVMAEIDRLLADTTPML